MFQNTFAVLSNEKIENIEYLQIAKVTIENLENENCELKEIVNELETNQNSSIVFNETFSKLTENYNVRF